MSYRNVYCLLTNDVEDTSIWFNSYRDETAIKILNEGLPTLLDIYNTYNIKTTFFFTAYVAKKFPQMVKLVVNRGHEIGSHGKSHLPENGFDIMPLNKQKRHLEYSKKLLEDISGQEVISFRAPSLRVSKNTSLALIETGFKIDSSVASQRFDFFLSFGSKNKFNWLISPRLPYRVKENNIFKKGNSELIELPLTALIFPYVGTTMRIFPRITPLIRNLIDLEAMFNEKPVIFLIHPNEFIDESDEIRIINRRSESYINYFIKDWIRSHLKIRNLGKSAIPLYKREIEFYIKKGYRFTTIKQYCKEIGFLI
ncbi:MAG: polysaccharide deacetylase family protein [Nitrososphaerota archaeon]